MTRPLSYVVSLPHRGTAAEKTLQFMIGGSALYIDLSLDIELIQAEIEAQIELIRLGWAIRSHAMMRDDGSKFLAYSIDPRMLARVAKQIRLDGEVGG
jgi:hypothetical protein